jgi:hypothetical protein
LTYFIAIAGGIEINAITSTIPTNLINITTVKAIKTSNSK